MANKARSERTDYISRGILTETEQKFSDAKWFFNYMGMTIVNEEEFGLWMEGQINHMILALHGASGGAMSAFPLLVRDVDRVLRRSVLIGLYLGGRRFSREMGEGLEKPKAVEGSTAPIGEVGEEDFRDPDSTEV